jgi:dTDP-glucose pyrophosphorylase
MGQRHKKKVQPDPAEWISEPNAAEETPRPLVIIGAGMFLSDLIRLLKDHSEFQTIGILDPAPTLRHQNINGIPVLGWLESLPPEAQAAVIGTPATPQAFDREAVFRILIRRGLSLPILTDASSRCAADVSLSRGTVLLSRASIGKGATIGENCLFGTDAEVAACAHLADHAVLMPSQSISFNEDTRAPQSQPRSLEATLARETDSIQEIIRRINWANMEIILVVAEQGALLGTITDGDIRRGILAGIDSTQPVSMIMNRTPTTVPLGTPYHEMLEIMRRRSIRHLPVVDNENRPVRLERMENLLDRLTGQGAVVMAGGMGMRLRPLTNDTPKPLLPVAGRPILDHILGGLRESGIEDVVISVNYLGERIRDHVGDGKDHHLNVNYIAERERLGTAGALSLIRPRPRRPFLVMNGDLLTKMNFAKLLQFQKKHEHDIVMCVRKHQFQVPYGVVDIREGCVTGLREKPVIEQFINAGIYVLNPACIDLIPRNRFFDMTDLIQVVLDQGGSVGAFPIIEYWRDIGNPADLQAAGREHGELGAETAAQNEQTPRVPVEAIV